MTFDENGSGSSLTPVASLRVSNGNRIDFYDAGEEGILITELGKTPTPPALKGLDHTLRAVDTWKILSPAVPPPQALLDLQVRADAQALLPHEPASNLVVNPTSSDGPAPETVITGPAASVPDGVSVKQEADGTCGNGCCDASWMLGNLCDLSGNYFNWFKFNVGWSWVQEGKLELLFEYACAATGSSRFGVHVGNFVGSFIVPEGFYQSYSMHDSCGCHADNHSVVNTNGSNQPVSPTNAHSFCGSSWR
jgi:hypothetical protein